MRGQDNEIAGPIATAKAHFNRRIHAADTLWTPLLANNPRQSNAWKRR